MWQMHNKMLKPLGPYDKFGIYIAHLVGKKCLKFNIFSTHLVLAGIC